jgi:hypothetical protein
MPMRLTHLLAGTEQGLYRLRLGTQTGKPELIALDRREVDPIHRDATNAGILYANAADDGLWRTKTAGRPGQNSGRRRAGEAAVSV